MSVSSLSELLNNLDFADWGDMDREVLYRLRREFILFNPRKVQGNYVRYTRWWGQEGLKMSDGCRNFGFRAIDEFFEIIPARSELLDEDECI